MRKIILAALVFLAPLASYGATRFVDDTGSDVGDCTNSGSPCQTIQYAVDQSGDGDMIQIAAGNYSENVILPIAVFTTSLTFNGAGIGQTVVDGGDADRVFLVALTSAATVTFNDMTLQNGINTSGGGMVIDTPNGTAVLNRVSFESNIANSNGGAILVRNSTLTLNNSTLLSNEAGPDAGFGQGGGIYGVNSTININDSLIQANIAHQDSLIPNPGEGGGIFIVNSDLTLLNSTVDSNIAEGQTGVIGEGGAGLYIECGGTVDITASTISNNVSGTEGGGIYIGNCAPALLDITNSTISGNRADGFGGGIFTNSPDTINLVNVTITNNEADSDGNDFGDGGGIARLLIFTAVPETLKLGTTQNNAYNSVNTIIAGNLVNNSTNTGNPDCLAPDESGPTFFSLGGNIIGTLGDDGVGGVGCEFAVQASDQTGTNSLLVDPLLGPLAANGGPTLTHLPQVGPAIDRALLAFCPATDQRGLPRPAFAGCDVGAVELQPTPTPTPTPIPTATPGGTPLLEGAGCDLMQGWSASNFGLGYVLLLGLPLGFFWYRRREE